MSKDAIGRDAVQNSAEDARYSLLHRLLHWLIALLILLALIAGAFLWNYGFAGLRDTFGMPATNLIYKYHKTAGVLILGLMLLRLALRLGAGVPAPVSTLTPVERGLSQAVHWLLYAAVIAMAAVGWLATAAGGFPVEFFDWKLPGLIGKDKALSETLYLVHGLLALTILALAGLHIAGALRHWKVKRDGVMRRMSLLG